ncbi:neuronal acetylcholine receptor subunit alpha-2-like [Saccoglossus kowalevskii]
MAFEVTKSRSVAGVLIFSVTIIILSRPTNILAADDNYLSSEERLLHHLLDNYTVLSRPIHEVNDTVEVFFWMSLTQLIDVDEKAQIITTSAWIYQEWTDHRLSWRECDYEGLTSVVVPVGRIWNPDLSLLNSDDNEFEGFPRLNINGLNLILHSNGVVFKVTPQILHTPCIMDITYFPVDVQSCEYEFGMWAYTDRQVVLRPQQDNAPLEKYIPNVEWDILTTKAVAIAKTFMGVSDTFTSIIVTMEIKRKPLYYIVNLILPCVVVSMLTVVVFCLPSVSTDKVSLSISLLLTIYVFNLLVIDLLPATSVELPYVTVYLLFSIILIGLSVMLTAFVSRLYNRADRCPTRVPNWARNILLGKLADILLVKRRGTRKKSSNSQPQKQ